MSRKVNPLSNILVLHPGSRNLRLGRASDFYPKEIPNCIARSERVYNRVRDPPIPGSRWKRLGVEQAEARAAKKAKLDGTNGNGNGNGNGATDGEAGTLDDDEDSVDPVSV